jgi:alanyl-tRNA synthetase
LKNKVTNLFLVLGAKIEDKAHLTVMISENLVETRAFHAGNLIRELAKEIQGGGGGQPYFATAGGKLPDGLPGAIRKARAQL